MCAMCAMLGLPGCGGEDADRLADDVRQRAEEVRDRAEDLRDRGRRLRDRVKEIRDDARRVGDELASRVREALDDLEQAVPRAGPQTDPPRVGTRDGTTTIDAFLTESLRSIDRYWTRTFRASGLPEPQVRYAWVPPGRQTRSACGAAADDRAAFYCPADDTIYVGQVLAAGVYEGVARGSRASRPARAAPPATSASPTSSPTSTPTTSRPSSASSPPAGRARRRGPSSCRPTAWRASGAARSTGPGLLQPGDVEEALGTALAVGDFEVGSEQHHGTPAGAARRAGCWASSPASRASAATSCAPDGAPGRVACRGVAERRIAVCDLGSNSFRLVVFTAGDGWWKRTDEIYEAVRIGEGLAETGELGAGRHRRARWRRSRSSRTSAARPAIDGDRRRRDERDPRRDEPRGVPRRAPRCPVRVLSDGGGGPLRLPRRGELHDARRRRRARPRRRLDAARARRRPPRRRAATRGRWARCA